MGISCINGRIPSMFPPVSMLNGGPIKRSGLLPIGSNCVDICICVQSIMNLGLASSSIVAVPIKSSKPESGVCVTKPVPCVGSGDMLVASIGPFGIGGLWSKKLVSANVFASGLDVFAACGSGGGCGCCCGELLFEPFVDELAALSEELVLLDSTLTGARVACLDCLRVGRRVHRRFRPAQRLQGNFLSHLVFVFAQLLHAIGVRPADLGIMPLLGGRPSWLLASRPWTVKCRCSRSLTSCQHECGRGNVVQQHRLL